MVLSIFLKKNTVLNMQDSLEDYIRISSKTKQDETPKISKELQITAQRKKECDIRAMKIVEFAIEGKLRSEIFTKCLPFINQSHYQDIVEERALTKLCGYSVCGKKIPEMPKKQFFISTKSNRVYDITDRKNYCSNFCYKASLHIKKQIDNSPLWLRKLEDIPEYSLLPISESGLPGEYIDQGIAKPVIEQSFTSISSFTQLSLNDVSEREIRPKRTQKRNGNNYKKLSKLQSTMQTISENEIEQVEEEEISNIEPENNRNTANSVKKQDTAHKKHNCIVNLPSIDEIEEKPEPQTIQTAVTENKKETPTCVKKEEESVKVSRTNKKSSKPQKINVETTIKKCVKEWLTLESYIFIHGEYKIKEILNENKLSDYFDTLNVTSLQIEQQKKYMDICKRLQLQEMADEKFDKSLLGNTKLKPVPDYKKLKEECKDLTIKVKSFYAGSQYETEDTNFPVKEKDKQKETENEEETTAVLPLVDVSSQNAMRRKIFMNSVNKAMQQLLRSMNVTNYSSILSDIQTFVKTFKLKADNIVFKPIIWSYVCYVLLQILAVRDENIKTILNERKSKEHINLILNVLPNKNNFISDIMTYINNIDSFVESYITRVDM